MEEVSVVKEFLTDLLESAIVQTTPPPSPLPGAFEARERDVEQTESDIPAELAALDISAVVSQSVPVLDEPEPEPEPTGEDSSNRLSLQREAELQAERREVAWLNQEKKESEETEAKRRKPEPAGLVAASPPSSPPHSPEKDDDDDEEHTPAAPASDPQGAGQVVVPSPDPGMSLTERVLWEREHRPKPRAECTLANLRSHSSKLQNRLVELRRVTRGLSGFEAPEDEQLMGKLCRREHRPLSRQERLWLKEAKKQSKRLKEEAVAVAEEKAADRAQLASNKVAKRAGKRWITHTRIKRREHERRYREDQLHRRDQAVACQWERFLQRRAEDLYSVYLTPPPTHQQLMQSAAQTDGGYGDHSDHVAGDFGGRMPIIPQAHEVHSMDSSGLRASIGLDVDLTSLKGEPAGRPLPGVDVTMSSGMLLHDINTKSGYLDTTAVGTTTRLRREAQKGGVLSPLPRV